MTDTSIFWATGLSAGTSTGTNWTNSSNALDPNDSTFAAWANTSANAVGTITLNGYNGQTAMGGVQPPSIDQVQATIYHYVTNTTRVSAATAQLFSGLTPIGTTVTLTRTTTTTNSQTITFPAVPTWAQCTDLRIEIKYTRFNGTQAGTANVDAAGMVISYTPSLVEHFGTANLAGVGQLTTAATVPLSGLQDNFDDNTIDTGKWSNNAGTVSEVGGRARVTAGTGWSSYGSRSTYTMDSLALRVFPPAVGGSEAYAAVILRSAGQAGNTNVLMMADTAAGTLTMTTRTAGSYDVGSAIITYDSTAHAWWRIRRSGASLLFETAPEDGTGNPGTWTQHNSQTTPAWIDASDFGVTLEAHRDAGSDFAEFDGVNTAANVPPEHAGAAALTGVGGLTATADVISAAVTSVVSIDLVGVDVSYVPAAGINLAGVGQLTATAEVIKPATAALAGQGQLTVTAVREQVGAVSMAGAGQLTVTAIREQPTGAVAMAAAGQLTAAATREIPSNRPQYGRCRAGHRSGHHRILRVGHLSQVRGLWLPPLSGNSSGSRTSPGRGR